MAFQHVNRLKERAFNVLIHKLKSNIFPINQMSQYPVIVFESDDWGLLRMPSIKVRNEIIQFYPLVKNNPFLMNDCLEREDDLEILFNLLSKHKDSFGHKPKITANFVCQNPDFSQIENSGFSQYISEPFQHTYKRFPGCEGSFALQALAYQEQIFIPQFHCREHVNVSRWMNHLLQDRSLVNACKYGLVNYITDSGIKSPCISQYMDSMNAENLDDLNAKIKNTLEGLIMFKNTWGFSSSTMIAPCYFWHPLLEDAVADAGIKAFQGLRKQKVPMLKNDPYRYKKVNRKMGEKNKNGQYYLVRNSFFEPSTDINKDWVSCCLKEIVSAIKRCGIAVISIHRVNFMGGIDVDNRDRNLVLFSNLLDGIEKIFPQFSYLSSGDVIKMFEEVNNGNKS